MGSVSNGSQNLFVNVNVHFLCEFRVGLIVNHWLVAVSDLLQAGIDNAQELSAI